jgi:hypothetical protein
MVTGRNRSLADDAVCRQVAIGEREPEPQQKQNAGVAP